MFKDYWQTESEVGQQMRADFFVGHCQIWVVMTAATVLVVECYTCRPCKFVMIGIELPFWSRDVSFMRWITPTMCPFESGGDGKSGQCCCEW